MRLAVRIRFTRAAAGGRAEPPVVADYRPHLRVGDGAPLGVRFEAGGVRPAWGEVVDATAELVYSGLVDYAALVEGAAFTLLEGPHAVGDGIVVGPVDEPQEER